MMNGKKAKALRQIAKNLFSKNGKKAVRKYYKLMKKDLTRGGQ